MGNIAKGSIVVKAITTAIVVAIISLISINSFVYPRTEGEKLEKRVNRFEDTVRGDIKELSHKIDKLIMLKCNSKGS